MYYFTNEQRKEIKEKIEKELFFIYLKDLSKTEARKVFTKMYNNFEEQILNQYLFIEANVSDYENKYKTETILFFINADIAHANIPSENVNLNLLNDLKLMVLSHYPLEFKRFTKTNYQITRTDDQNQYKNLLLSNIPVGIHNCRFNSDYFYQKFFPQLRTNYYSNINMIQSLNLEGEF